MSDTDIYKQREPMPYGSRQAPKKPRRRRRSSKRSFDDTERKRRSSNSGVRRFLHLAKKKENEKFYWGTLITVILVALIFAIIWQFFYIELKARRENQGTQRSGGPKLEQQQLMPANGH